jgi:hypothetical protein
MLLVRIQKGPYTLLNVFLERNTGCPVSREAYGYGVIIVLVGVTPDQDG